jgi:cellulose synthase/poly-beta-1,6-N-acetylglucosamine synthase-like glycosyltransferase
LFPYFVRSIEFNRFLLNIVPLLRRVQYASTIAWLLTIGWVVFLIMSTIWKYNSAGRIVIEIFLSLLSFFGLFWNSYFITAMIFKCFIPAKAFLTNTKYCTIIPEEKNPTQEWLDVTIQIPVYKESLHEVLMPTLKSCITARDHYRRTTGAKCNIVLCDDGMMNMLRDNFPAAEMLWESILESQGRTVRLSQLLKHVPRASRRHLKGMRSKDVYEVFHRMLYYYHFDIGFVARSTVDRRGKFKKASNLNSHLRLALGAQQRCNQENDLPIAQALIEESHNDDGSRFVMFGNDILIGHLICVNDADARMAEPVISKTVPEFLNDPTLGFTQHTTKTMNDQRGESYFTNMLTVYTDALYQGHFLLSSILGCHPPLVGHSIFLRTEALNQCGRMRTLRKAQQWLKNIGLQFLPVDQVGFANLQAQNRTEYWSENHVSEDFELMIHLYNLGFNGRYICIPDCEFQEGITRTFDEEAGRHRKFALGAHELVFNPFQDMLGKGVFTPLFRTFLQSDIPSYYKVFLTAYLCSYTSGGAYIIVFVASALVRIFDQEDEIDRLYYFSPAGVIILNFIIYYIIGYVTFLISMLRMYYINNKLLFGEYRKKCCGAGYIVFVMLRYCLVFQFLFYNVATFTFYFLGSMDHLLARPSIVGATNKDSINISRCRAFWDMAKFNSGSWFIAAVLGGLAYLTILQDQDWDFTKYPTERNEIINHSLFAGPAAFLALLTFVVPIILNPWILGWPFLHEHKPQPKPEPLPKSTRVIRKDALGRELVDLSTYVSTTKQLDNEIARTQQKPDVELGSLATREISRGSPATGRKGIDGAAYLKEQEARRLRLASLNEPNGRGLNNSKHWASKPRTNMHREV